MSHNEKGVLCLTFLIYPSEDNPKKYVAHCLELDIVAVEKSKPRAILLLKDLITDLLNVSTEDGTFDQVFNPAPKKYWKMLAHSKNYDPSEKVKQHKINELAIGGVNYALAGAF